MTNPLSLRNFYFRNKRKVLPVVGILALAILGVVVTDSLLASARETAYATFGSYQKLILVAPRATRDQDLANPLQDSLARLHDVQLQVDALDGPGGITSYYNAVIALPAQARAQLPAVQRLEIDAANARYYAARLRGDLVPLGDLIVRVQRLQTEEQAFNQLVSQLMQHPNDPRPLITYLQQHQTWLQSVLPDSAQLGRLQLAVGSASADANGLQQSLQALNRDTASLNRAGQNLADLPVPPSPTATIDQFRSALDQLTASLGSIEQPQPGLDKLLADSARIPGTALVKRDAYSNLDINLLAGNAQFDLYGIDQPGMTQLLTLYGDRVVAGRLPRQNASEIAVSEEIARSRHVAVGGQLGNNLDELDRLPDAFTVVGIIRGPTRLGIIPLDYMTQHYLFERRYQGLIVIPQSGHEQAVHEQLQRLVGNQAFRLFDWPYIKAKIDSLIANLDSINRFLILLVTLVLSLVVGLLNNLFFRQRMNEFGLLAAVGYSRWGLIRRVALESFGVTLAAWLVGVGVAVAVLSWFNAVFMIPHGLLMNVFDWNVLALHTLPIPLMVFLFGMGTVGWQLLRLDPISIIERRD
ncbi:MAG: FtsX-like permease family protein [Chloroflexi bacterium]|nr:MAG: FtsX-like permease family protein [Chloroflexota bacterium]TMD65702.1 MAG: FtsX-like permease family protein [Chloroflexota bacterium]